MLIYLENFERKPKLELNLTSEIFFLQRQNFLKFFYLSIFIPPDKLNTHKAHQFIYLTSYLNANLSEN